MVSCSIFHVYFAAHLPSTIPIEQNTFQLNSVETLGWLYHPDKRAAFRHEAALKHSIVRQRRSHEKSSVITYFDSLIKRQNYYYKLPQVASLNKTKKQCFIRIRSIAVVENIFITSKLTKTYTSNQSTKPVFIFKSPLADRSKNQRAWENCPKL